jgi:hypothetical protein
MAAISHVFTITRVAEIPGEDKELLFELSIDMFPENNCLHILGKGDDETTGFTDYGIECLKQIIQHRKIERPAIPSPQPIAARSSEAGPAAGYGNRVFTAWLLRYSAEGVAGFGLDRLDRGCLMVFEDYTGTTSREVRRAHEDAKIEKDLANALHNAA